MNRQHFDARGKACHSWFDLKKIIRDERSQAILSGHMLFQVLVHPYIQIRLPKPFQGCIEVIHYGTGEKREWVKDLSPKQIEALRAFYLRAQKSGWTVLNEKHFVTFTREARVTVDHLKRWSSRRQWS